MGVHQLRRVRRSRLQQLARYSASAPTSLATVVPNPFHRPLRPSLCSILPTTSPILPLDTPACMRDLTTSVGTRIRHAAVSASEADNICEADGERLIVEEGEEKIGLRDSYVVKKMAAVGRE